MVPATVMVDSNNWLGACSSRIRDAYSQSAREQPGSELQGLAQVVWRLESAVADDVDWFSRAGRRARPSDGMGLARALDGEHWSLRRRRRGTGRRRGVGVDVFAGAMCRCTGCR